MTRQSFCCGARDFDAQSAVQVRELGAGFVDKMRRRFGMASLLVLASCLLTTTSASAQTYIGVTPPVVSTGETATVGSGQPQVAVLAVRVSGGPTEVVAQAPVGTLAFTGSDIASLVLLALSLVVAGSLIAKVSHRRSATGGQDS